MLCNLTKVMLALYSWSVKNEDEPVQITERLTLTLQTAIIYNRQSMGAVFRQKK